MGGATVKGGGLVANPKVENFFNENEISKKENTVEI